jgi:hypothetical protein
VSEASQPTSLGSASLNVSELKSISQEQVYSGSAYLERGEFSKAVSFTLEVGCYTTKPFSLPSLLL